MAPSVGCRQLEEARGGRSSMGYESIGPSKSISSFTLRSFFSPRAGRGLASAAALGRTCAGDDDATATSIVSTCACTTCLGGMTSGSGFGRGLVAGLIISVVLISAAAIAFVWRDSNRDWRDPASADSQLQEGPAALSATDGSAGVSSPRGWCLPNAVHQTFSGLIPKGEDDVTREGKWEGHHWWYHDAITNCFQILATIGGMTFGFWEAGIINVSGRTDYLTAAYKDGVCVFYEEHMETGELFDDVMCRGSTWAGNVSLEGEVEYGYGMKAERWGGTISDGHNSGDWGLPPGTQSLIDFQRNPSNEGEVRLLYHRVVAPTEGVLSWAHGDSLAFDFVFTGVQKMDAAEVQALVKVPKMCEVMAGEFHDQEALHNRGGGAGRRAAMRRGLFSTNTKPAEGTSEEGSHGATRMNTGASSFSRQTTETRDEVPEQSSAAVGEGRIGDLSPIHRLLASLGPRWYHSKARRG